MFALDASAVLTLEGVGFSRGKLSRQRPVGFDDAFFGSINFERVYHEGPIPREAIDEIQDRRMAEVIVPGSLPLQPYLHKVICRTSLERRTLLHHLGSRAAELASIITVEQVPQSTFLHKSLYLTDVGFRDGELSLDFHAPMALPRSGEYQVEVELRVEGQVVQGWRGAVPAGSPGLRIQGFRNLQGIWKVLLEEALAYEAPIPSETSTIR
jgi:hypothetical protein